MIRVSKKAVSSGFCTSRLLFFFGLVILMLGSGYLLIDSSRVYGYGMIERNRVVDVNKDDLLAILDDGSTVELSDRYVFIPYDGYEGYIRDYNLFTVPIRMNVVLARCLLFYMGFALMYYSVRNKSRVLLSVMGTIFMYLIGNSYFNCSYALMLPSIVVLLSFIISVSNMILKYKR